MEPKLREVAFRQQSYAVCHRPESNQAALPVNNPSDDNVEPNEIREGNEEEGEAVERHEEVFADEGGDENDDEEEDDGNHDPVDLAIGCCEDALQRRGIAGRVAHIFQNHFNRCCYCESDFESFLHNEMHMACHVPYAGRFPCIICQQFVELIGDGNRRQQAIRHVNRCARQILGE